MRSPLATAAALVTLAAALTSPARACAGRRPAPAPPAAQAPDAAEALAGLRTAGAPGGDLYACKAVGDRAVLARLSRAGELLWSLELAGDPGAEIDCGAPALHPDGSVWFAGAWRGEVDFVEAALDSRQRASFALGYSPDGRFLGGTFRLGDGPGARTVDVLPER
jgi:hypothetical protein